MSRCINVIKRIALLAALLCAASPAVAQQRPNITEDPETVGSGRLLFEAGVDWDKDVKFPLSGLTGDLFSVPNMGISLGLSSIVELQIDGGIYQKLSITDRDEDAPLSELLEADGDTTSSVRDLLIGTKIRLLSEQPGRPSLGVRFATRLPLASNESGLGRGTTDFTTAFLIGKTVESVRIVGNLGLLVLEDPSAPAHQDELLTYGLSLARAVAQGVELVGEVTGRVNFAEEDAIGAEDRGFFRVGARYTRGSIRVDGGILLGLSPRDPDFGVTAGLTWVVNAFQVP